MCAAALSGVLPDHRISCLPDYPIRQSSAGPLFGQLPICPLPIAPIAFLRVERSACPELVDWALSPAISRWIRSCLTPTWNFLPKELKKSVSHRRCTEKSLNYANAPPSPWSARSISDSANTSTPYFDGVTFRASMTAARSLLELTTSKIVNFEKS